MSPLFSDRAEELIYDEGTVKIDKKHPDRVYGLRETRLFARLLSADVRDGRGLEVGEIVRCSPFGRGGEEPLLFPFLILEAKSEKGADSFGSIEKQTAFPIRALLKIQEDLCSQCGMKPNQFGGPLTFFLSNRGEEWRVAAAFTEASREGTNYVSILILDHDIVLLHIYSIILRFSLSHAGLRFILFRSGNHGQASLRRHSISNHNSYSLAVKLGI